MSDEDGFFAEDYLHTSMLLRDAVRTADRRLFQAVCSNNFNIILAALTNAAKAAMDKEEAAP